MHGIQAFVRMKKLCFTMYRKRAVGFLVEGELSPLMRVTMFELIMGIGSLGEGSPLSNTATVLPKAVLLVPVIVASEVIGNRSEVILLYSHKDFPSCLTDFIVHIQISQMV